MFYKKKNLFFILNEKWIRTKEYGFLTILSFDSILFCKVDIEYEERAEKNTKDSEWKKNASFIWKAHGLCLYPWISCSFSCLISNDFDR